MTDTAQTDTPQETTAAPEAAEAQPVNKLALIEQLTHMFQEAGHPDPMAWVPRLYAFQPEVVDEENMEVQRFIINNFWFNELGQLDVQGKANTERARFSLQDHCDFMSWLKMFAADVLPCIMEHNL